MHIMDVAENSRFGIMRAHIAGKLHFSNQL